MVRTRVLSWLLASTVLATAAHAADLMTPAPALPVFTWTGFYAGANVGVGFDYSSNNPYTYTDPLELPGNRTSTLGFNNPGATGLAGIEIGYNWQINQIVFGFAGDYNWGFSNSRHNYFARRNCEITGCAAGFAGADNRTTAGQPDGYDQFFQNGNNGLNFGTARLKLGYSWDRALLYVTGGAAFSDSAAGGVINDYRLQTTANPISTNGVRPDVTFSDNTSTEWGWTIGGGLAYAITPNFSVKAEYLYVSLHANGAGTLVASTPNFGTIVGGSRTDTFSVARLGLDYKFFSF